MFKAYRVFCLFIFLMNVQWNTPKSHRGCRTVLHFVVLTHYRTLSIPSWGPLNASISPITVQTKNEPPLQAPPDVPRGGVVPSGWEPVFWSCAFPYGSHQPPWAFAMMLRYKKTTQDFKTQYEKEDNVCVLLKFLCWNLAPWCDGFRRWGLWKVSGHEGGQPVTRISVLIKETVRALSPPHEDTAGARKSSVNREEPPLPDSGSPDTLVWNSPGSRTVRKKCVLFQPPSVVLLL